MKSQIPSCWMWCASFLVLSSLISLAQCDPGPASGGGVNRCYDDGFVYVDITGNAGGSTWFWGYQSSSQLQGVFLVFHSRTNLDAGTTQVLTDTYSVSFLPLPVAPYVGTFQGPGVIIPDAPISRSTNIVTQPNPTIQRTATNNIVVSWPSPSSGWGLQQNSDLNTTNWHDVLITPDDDGTNKSIVVSPTVGRQFYRLKKL